MSSTIGLYLDISQEAANQLRDRLNRLAFRLGYSARRGPTYGEGNLAALLQGVDAGDCEIVRRRYWARDDNDLFDGLIGWANIYPPSSAVVAAALADVPEKYRAAIEGAFSAGAMDLRPVPPGGMASWGRVDRWAIDLAEDRSAEFGLAIDADLWAEDECHDAAYSFALDVATATDQELQARLAGDPTAGQGTAWGIDEETDRAWYAAR